MPINIYLLTPHTSIVFSLLSTAAASPHHSSIVTEGEQAAMYGVLVVVLASCPLVVIFLMDVVTRHRDVLILVGNLRDFWHTLPRQHHNPWSRDKTLWLQIIVHVGLSEQKSTHIRPSKISLVERLFSLCNCKWYTLSRALWGCAFPRNTYRCQCENSCRGLLLHCICVHLIRWCLRENLSLVHMILEDNA